NGEWPVSAYQTVFAMEAGSAEMPSAGRAFTPEMITDLIARGVDVAPLTLHAGVAAVEEHEDPPAEYYRVPATTARRVSEARRAGGRIIAVATTVGRAGATGAGGAGASAERHTWPPDSRSATRSMRASGGASRMNPIRLEHARPHRRATPSTAQLCSVTANRPPGSASKSARYPSSSRIRASS